MLTETVRIDIMEDYKNTPEGKETVRLYGDILHLQRPDSSRPKMDLTHRAKIFSPYDALTGFDEEIESTGRKSLEVNRIELSDEEKSILSDKLSQITKGIDLTVTVFVPEETTDKGFYQTFRGIVRRIDPIRKVLELQETKSAAGAGKIEKNTPIVIRFENLLNIELKTPG